MKKRTFCFGLMSLLLTCSAVADTVYEFANGNAGWSQRRNVSVEATNEGLKLTVNGTHPNIGINNCQIAAATARYMLIEYKLTGCDGKDHGRLFFATDSEPKLAENKKIIFRGLIPDGNWHTFRINLAGNAKWRTAKTITALRLDFMEKAAGEFTVKSIKLVENIPAGKCPVYSFAYGVQGWDSYRNATGTVTPEGLKLTIKGTHANMVNNNLNIDPASCPVLVVTYKATGYPKGKATMRVFFATDKDPKFDERKKIYGGVVVADGQWHTIKINPNNTAGGRKFWFDNGTITKLRIDFAEEKSGEFVVKEIKPEVSREGAWRNGLKKKGVPSHVPVALGHNPKVLRVAVWDNKQPFFESQMAAPAGRKTARGAVFLRREFQLPEVAVKQAIFQSVVDDRMTALYINGQKISHRWQSSWQRSDCVDVSKLLKPGKNVLAVEYFNDGAIGGAMFDLSIVLQNNGFINVTTAGTLGAVGKVPADWFRSDFVPGREFAPVELFPGPPNTPWTAAVPTYRNLRPAAGKVLLEELTTGGRSVKARFKTDFVLTGKEVFFAHLNRQDGSLIAYRSGSAQDLKVKKIDDKCVEVDFGNFDLPEYGGKIDVPLTLGIYNCDNSSITGRRFVFNARPYPGKNFTIKSVQTANGPVAELNGKPFYFNILTVNNTTVPTGMEGEKSPFNIVAFRAGGLRQIWWIGPDQYDFTEIDRQICKMIKDYPDSMLAVYLWCHPGTWYERVYPGRISRQANGSIRRYYTATVSFSDPDVRRDAVRAVSAFIEHCEANFGSKIAVYNLMGGISCEWQGWNSHTSQLADYSATAQREFAKYVEQKYAVSSAGIPDSDERKRTAETSSLFRDPVRDRMSILYDEFYSASIADCIVEIAAAAKKACGNRKLVGAYYGYLMEYGNLGYCMNGGGHNALYKLLQSPDIDFLLSPQSYGTRTVGNPNSDMKPFASAAMHGKFSMLEDDTRTHCTAYDGFCHSLNPDQTRSVLRRNIGMQLARKMPLNHLPLVGGNDLSDPAIRRDMLKAVAAGQKVMESNLPRVSEVAVVIDEQSAKYLASSLQRGKSFFPWMYKYDKNGDLMSPEHNVMLLTGELLYFQRIVLGQIGCPVDYILLEDAPEAAKKYKLLILLNCFENTPQLRQTFANAGKSGNHILSVYGSGFIGQEGFDYRNMSELLGMELTVAPAGALQLNWNNAPVGGEYKFEPRFAVNDPAASVLAGYSDKKGVAAASKANVTFYGAALLDADFVQQTARRAGVHIYMAPGDNLEIGCGILSLHSASAGRKVITLRKPCYLREIFTGEVIDGSSGKVEINMNAFDSKVFAVEEK